jgi:hypothetical protein
MLNLSATQLCQFSTVLPGGRTFFCKNFRENLVYFSRKLKIFAKFFCFREKFCENCVYFSRKFSQKRKTPICAKFLRKYCLFCENFCPNFCENLHFNPSWRDLATLVLKDTFRFRSSSEEPLKCRHRHRTPIEDRF